MTGKPQQCTADGCDRRPVARRLCPAHYQQAWKAGELDNHRKLPPRPRKRTRCPADHKHAEKSTCFIQHQCRCTPCVDAHNAREQRRNKLKAYGRYDNGLVDVAPVREHVLMLGEYGIGYKRVAQLCGFKSSTPVRTIIWGRQDPGPRYGEMQKRVKRETAEKILAIQPTIDNMGDGAKVPAVGTHRRIQALAARGWSLSKLSRRLDIDIPNFWTMMRRDHVLAATHRRVAALYEELWDQAPPNHEWHDKAAYTRSKNYARKRGWLPPAAWDDIDDPAEHPEVDTVRQGRATAEEILEDVEFLLELGEAPAQIASMVGRKPLTLAKLAWRNGRPDLGTLFESRRAA